MQHVERWREVEHSPKDQLKTVHSQPSPIHSTPADRRLSLESICDRRSEARGWEREEVEESAAEELLLHWYELAHDKVEGELRSSSDTKEHIATDYHRNGAHLCTYDEANDADDLNCPKLALALRSCDEMSWTYLR